jgi:SulP family sulfate permease
MMFVYRAVINAIPYLLTPVWMRPGFKYSKDDLRADAIAGLTVAIIQIPQAMAFALIAGLPAVYGLYASLPGAVASLWGSSRLMSTGPVAMVSLLTFTSLVSLAEPGSAEFIWLAATLAFLTGVMYTLLGFFRMGQMIHLVPHSVIAGFSSAAAILIVVSQLPNLFGVTVPQSDVALVNMLNFITSLPHIHMLTVLVGAAAIALLYFTKSLPRSFPSALSVLLIGLLATYVFNLHTHGVAIVGAVPSGLPGFLFPSLDVASVTQLLPKAAVLAVVAFVATHANAATLARRTRETLDTDQELVGQGLANIVAGFFQGYPIAGSFTRSAINSEAGARSGFSSVVSMAVTVIAVLFLTPILFYLPKAALAAVVVLSAVSLVDYKRILAIYQVSRSDGIVAFFTFGLVFVVKPEMALLTGMVVALVLFVRQTVWGAHIAEVGIDLDRKVLLTGSDDHPVHYFSGVAIIRVSISLYYANADHVLRQVDALIQSHELRMNHRVRDVVLDMSGVNFIDISGMEVLDEYIHRVERRNVRVSMIYVRTKVYEILKNTEYFDHRTIFYDTGEMRRHLQLV